MRKNDITDDETKFDESNFCSMLPHYCQLLYLSLVKFHGDLKALSNKFKMLKL